MAAVQHVSRGGCVRAQHEGRTHGSLLALGTQTQDRRANATADAVRLATARVARWWYTGAFATATRGVNGCVVNRCESLN